MPEKRDTSPRMLSSTERMLMPFGVMEDQLRMVRLNEGKPLKYERRGVASVLGRDAARVDWSNFEVTEEDLLIRAGGVGVICIDAPVFSTASFWAALFGCVTVGEINRALYAAAGDESIDRIVLDMNCPGGQCAAIGDLVEALDDVAKIKPVITLAHNMSASLAYWMATRTHRIVASTSAEVGSIGAICVAYDDSGWFSELGIRAVPITEAEQKTFGHMGVAISEEMIDREMAIIRDIGTKFRASVTAKTGIDDQALLDMQGAMFLADTAQAMGLVDEVRATGEFYAAVAAGEYDQYMSDQREDEPTEPSGERAATTLKEDDMSDAKKKAKKSVAEMSAEEKEAMRLALNEEEEATTEEEEEEAENEEEEEEASEEEDEEETAEEDQKKKESRRKPHRRSASRMTVGKAEAILKPHKGRLTEAAHNRLVLEAVRGNQSSDELLSACVAEALDSGEQSSASSAAKGSDGFIGGGSQGSSGGTGTAEAQFDAAVDAEMKANPSLQRHQAARNVSVKNPKLRDAMVAEANPRR